MDLADYAKRESKFDESRYLFKIVVSQQPYAYQGWLEYAKMEEECGNQEASRDILLKGLHFNPFSENLFIKAVKIEEKMNNFEQIREMVENIRANRDISIEKYWRILLEGALFEGRCGNRVKARQQFQFLLKKCRNYGPVFLEASKYEEREDQIEQAIDICDQGLEHNCKYSPLWFQYLRLYEKSDEKLRAKKFERLPMVINDLFKHINKEFHWKIQIEAAQTYDRIGTD